MKKIIIFLIIFGSLFHFSPFSENPIHIREQFLAKLTFDLFQNPNKQIVFKKYNMTLAEGLDLFKEGLNSLQKDENKENYKKYQDSLKSLLNYYSEK